MTYRVLKVVIDPPLERACPECRSRAIMKTTGELLHDRTGWYLAFFCPQHREYFPVQAPEYRDLIERHTRRVDPRSLPLLGNQS